MKKPTKPGEKTKGEEKPAALVHGCCTLMGSGPDEQHEGLTREECRLLSIRKGKNFSWVAGLCAEPD
jgi:hypothetical protein